VRHACELKDASARAQLNVAAASREMAAVSDGQLRLERRLQTLDRKFESQARVGRNLEQTLEAHGGILDAHSGAQRGMEQRLQALESAVKQLEASGRREQAAAATPAVQVALDAAVSAVAAFPGTHTSCGDGKRWNQGSGASACVRAITLPCLWVWLTLGCR
jgi:chromosome segregation ATPase